MSGASGKSFDKGHAAQAEAPAKASASRSSGSAYDAVFALQRAAGNRAVTSLLGGSSGKALDSATREEMEGRFGRDFGDVRIHDNESASASAFAAGARAYTYGRDIVFGPGFYSPASSTGRRLIAHELTHVIQQTRMAGHSATPAATESEARQAAASVVGGQTASVQAPASTGAQADPMSKDEIQQRIAENEEKAANASPQEADELFQERDALLAQLKKADVGQPAAAAAPQANQPDQTANQPPSPAPSAEDLQKASDAEALSKAGITADQARDYATLPHGAVMDKYGFFNFWKIRSAADSLPGGVVTRTLPKQDTTLYLQPSGRVATNADERANQLSERISSLQPPTALGAIAVAGRSGYAYATTGKPASFETLQNWQQLGDVSQQAFESVAPVLASRGTAARRNAERSVDPAQPEAEPVPPAAEGQPEHDIDPTANPSPVEQAQAAGAEPPQGLQNTPPEIAKAGIDPTTGERLYTPAQEVPDQEQQSPVDTAQAGVDPVTGERLYTPAQEVPGQGAPLLDRPSLPLAPGMSTGEADEAAALNLFRKDATLLGEKAGGYDATVGGEKIINSEKTTTDKGGKPIVVRDVTLRAPDDAIQIKTITQLNKYGEKVNTPLPDLVRRNTLDALKKAYNQPVTRARSRTPLPGTNIYERTNVEAPKKITIIVQVPGPVTAEMTAAAAQVVQNDTMVAELPPVEVIVQTKQ